MRKEARPNMEEEILALKEAKDAVILAHNYQVPEVQDIADFQGDSLELAKKAKKVDQEIIVFCGVKFMAEMAHMLNPDKKTLIPTEEALCPMAGMADPEGLRRETEAHPDAAVVSYVNTTAEIKAMSDICVTSANAEDIVRRMDAEEVIFVPDTNLGHYVRSQVKEKTVHLYPGYCHTHMNLITKEAVEELMKEHPRAKVLIHPECKPKVIALADSVESTGGMVRYVRDSGADEFIIGTEKGLAYRLKKEFPGKKIYELEGAVCTAMKSITLDKLKNSLQKEVYEVVLPPDIQKRALEPIDLMLEMS